MDARLSAKETRETETDFLAKDFENCSASYWKNEALGESRLKFFVGLVTAVFGGLGFLAKDGAEIHIKNVQVMACGAVFALVILGVLTLLRIVRRNRVSSGFVHAMKMIRQRLVDSGYWREYTAQLPPGGRTITNGGLAHVVVAINAGLVFLLIVFLCWREGQAFEVKCVFYALAAGGLAFAVQAQFVARKEGSLAQTADRPRSEAPADSRGMNNSFRANVGMLVERQDGKVLAIERADAEGTFQLPQGGLERDESPEEAARRELQEETGLKSEEVELRFELPEWLVYELPSIYRSQKTGRGQVQKWFFYRLRPGVDPENVLGRRVTSEESRQRLWMPLDQVLAGATEFRGPVYRRVVKEWRALREM